jgi:hypothetical protein
LIIFLIGGRSERLSLREKIKGEVRSLGPGNRSNYMEGLDVDLITGTAHSLMFSTQIL